VSWYRVARLIFLLWLGSPLGLVAQEIDENRLIIEGVFYEEHHDFELSRLSYATLYDRTSARVYLFREVTVSILGKTHLQESIQRLTLWASHHPDSLETPRLLIPLYLSTQQLDEAKAEAKWLLGRSKQVIDLELASNPFLYAGEFTQALKLLERIYTQTSNEKILLRMATIMEEFTQEQERAIRLLETHRLMNYASDELYTRLLRLYAKVNSAEGLLRIYTVLYEERHATQYLTKILDVYAYQKDISGAIAFLEKHQVAKRTLYQLYKRQRLFDKAYALIDELYAEEGDARWIAEKGILLFEKAEDKASYALIRQVLFYFEKAIGLGVDDSVYLNYYGYTLIDREIDIPKGIAILQDALRQQPENTYYLDSLAWGYYKTKQCQKAYELMERVVAEEGTDQPEILNHWDAIQKCK